MVTEGPLWEETHKKKSGETTSIPVIHTHSRRLDLYHHNHHILIHLPQHWTTHDTTTTSTTTEPRHQPTLPATAQSQPSTATLTYSTSKTPDTTSKPYHTDYNHSLRAENNICNQQPTTYRPKLKATTTQDKPNTPTHQTTNLLSSRNCDRANQQLPRQHWHQTQQRQLQNKPTNHQHINPRPNINIFNPRITSCSQKNTSTHYYTTHPLHQNHPQSINNNTTPLSNHYHRTQKTTTHKKKHIFTQHSLTHKIQPLIQPPKTQKWLELKLPHQTHKPTFHPHTTDQHNHHTNSQTKISISRRPEKIYAYTIHNSSQHHNHI